MKHVLKILIPLVLVVAVAAGAAWYFLSYRPDLTCEFYVNRAEAAVSKGRYSKAVKYYTRAWELYPDDVDLAIALANAYKLDDNYTKAEYTLVSAITEMPDCLDLYLALSKTYVEQDKLLDADQMLSRTSNESIQAQLDELRPDPPVIQPESGYYTEYIDVSLSYSGDAAYLSTNGSYPSLDGDLYTGPVTLEAGESTVVAIVVSEDGLVSKAVTAGYTVGGVIEEYTFTDPAVETAVRSVLGKEEGQPVMTNEMWTLTDLELTSDVRDLSDLSICRGLTSLTLHEVYGIDFSVLENLTALETLDLSNCTVSSGGLRAIGKLQNLTSLKLSNCAITDVSALSGLSNLQILDLSGNVITDISSLSGLTSLTEVNLNGNAVSSISSLASAASLAKLDITGNQVTSLTPLSNKTSLTELHASQNGISDLTPLGTCTALTTLEISNNAVADLTPLAGLASLSTLDASENSIASLPDFSAAASLSQVSLSNNSIADVSGLSGLEYLNYLDIDYNNVSDLSPLLECRNLVQVNAFANPITDVAQLQEHGVIVNYDPTYTAEATAE